MLLPTLDLVDNARASIDELMSEGARGPVEQQLVLTAQETAGAKHSGRSAGEIVWHGSQPRHIVLAERKLARAGAAASAVVLRFDQESPAIRRARDDAPAWLSDLRGARA